MKEFQQKLQELYAHLSADIPRSDGSHVGSKAKRGACTFVLQA
jgi:hypothetical protein